MQVLPDLAADLEQLQHKPTGAVLPIAWAWSLLSCVMP